MIKKLKLVLATSIALVGAGAGFAAAKNFNHADRAMKQRYDVNNDGVLDDAERAKLKADRHGKRKAGNAARIAKFDTNKDGTLDDNERATMQRERSAARFKQLDSNGDGVLSPEEFAKPNHARGGMHKRR